jgi:hypothetical protein
MKGDFTRMTFDPKKHYRGVLMQQGRVQLDADWNEQLAIQSHRDETETRDVIGGCGTPIDQPGFTLITDASTLPANVRSDLTKAKVLPLATGDFLIGPGRYYVDGILCENEDYVLYTRQPNWPGDDPNAAPSQPDPEIKPIVDAGLYQVYLDVWTRHITALDDDSIREKALGGPDTTTRAKTIWQVKVNKLDADTLICATAPLPGDESTGQLSARSKPLDDAQNDCDVPPGAGFRRLENQLYRVEIHTGGNRAAATFKWSRDNAAMVTTWTSKNGNDLTVGSGGPDEVLGFASNQWVELSDDTRELQGKPGTLVKLETAVGQTLTINPLTATGPVERNAFPLNPKVRRWDTLAASGGTRKTSATDAPNGFFRLEDGVEIKFEAGQYRTGDYWLIPARTANADVEWPRDTAGDPIPQPKHGIYHHTCSLALLKFDTATKLSVQEDCRPFFPPLTDLTCLYYVGGDGQAGTSGQTLPKPLKVGVANGNHPLPNASVEFAILRDDDIEVSTSTVLTDTSGIAQFSWKLGEANELRVRAQLKISNKNVHLPIIFSAQLGKGDAEEPGFHVTDIKFLPPYPDGTQFRNDTEFSADILAGGIAITCDENVNVRPLSVRSRFTSDSGAQVSPTVFVTLDLPYPFNRADRELWGNPVIAYQPLILSSNVSSDGNVIYWAPEMDTKAWLTGLLFRAMQRPKRGQSILAHLTLKGNFIWSEDSPDLYLDGEVLGVEDSVPDSRPSIAAKLPSGDKRRGGDLEMWFWLVAPPQEPEPELKHVVLMVNPAVAVFEQLLDPNQTWPAEIFSLALDRTKLRDVVPPGFGVDISLPFDIDGAQELAERHNLQGIRFITWADAVLSDAADLMSETLTQINIGMATRGINDLMIQLKTARNRPDAVLVDADLAEQLAPLGYTKEIARL